MFASTYPIVPGKEAWRQLEQAETAFENGELDKALILAENSRETRRISSEWSENKLIAAYKPIVVQREGTDLNTLRKIFEERQDKNAVEIIDYSLTLHPAEYYNFNIKNVITYWHNSSNYPEADIITAAVYRQEGEYDLSQHYLENAWKYRDLLDIPEQKYDILYDLADTAFLLKDNELYEKSLLLILSDDKDFSGTEKNQNRLSSGFVRAIKKGTGSDKLFILYRHDSPFGLSAMIKLSDYYQAVGQNDRALECSAFGCLTAITAMNNSLKQYKDDYTFSTVENLFQEVDSINEICNWMDKYDVWNSFYNFALLIDITTENKSLSKDILSALANKSHNKIIQKKALLKLLN
jgi:hypothetical protein